nr:MAG TPA: hypothetical protein [Caudoviricetes sp.]
MRPAASRTTVLFPDVTVLPAILPEASRTTVLSPPHANAPVSNTARTIYFIIAKPPEINIARISPESSLPLISVFG